MMCDACIKLSVFSTWDVTCPIVAGEYAVNHRKGTDKVILERLDSAFGRVHTVVMRLNQQEVTIVCGEDFFDLFGTLIVHHV